MIAVTGAGAGVRRADYARPETLPAALAGAEKVLLVSSNEVGRRTAQHGAVIEAARRGRAPRAPLAGASEPARRGAAPGRARR